MHKKERMFIQAIGNSKSWDDATHRIFNFLNNPSYRAGDNRHYTNFILRIIYEN